MQHPAWLKVKIGHSAQFVQMRQLVSTHHLHTVCESASCPNIAECWGRGTATFLLLGNRCTRRCRFCDVPSGSPEPLDPEEPQRVAEAVLVLALKYAVLTSVTRDDLPDGGAAHWAETIRQVRALNPGCSIEVLIPDFQGNSDALHLVYDARPDILGHNLETVPRLYSLARPQAVYQRSLAVLRQAHSAGFTTKSGVMLGMGETPAEILAVMQDLRQADCDLVTFGQYLQPTPAHVPIARYWTPEEFEQVRLEGLRLGFRHVEAGPLVRSSYHAEQALSAPESDPGRSSGA